MADTTHRRPCPAPGRGRGNPGAFGDLHWRHVLGDEDCQLSSPLLEDALPQRLLKTPSPGDASLPKRFAGLTIDGGMPPPKQKPEKFTPALVFGAPPLCRHCPHQNAIAGLLKGVDLGLGFGGDVIRGPIMPPPRLGVYGFLSASCRPGKRGSGWTPSRVCGSRGGHALPFPADFLCVLCVGSFFALFASKNGWFCRWAAVFSAVCGPGAAPTLTISPQKTGKSPLSPLSPLRGHPRGRMALDLLDKASVDKLFLAFPGEPPC